ncbi:MAG: coenzyme F420-0:L-glutamate ligase [Actinobacteria bacterium]|nr:coenzyme F420-0:L-glutamate ligase [Actinomycetota bacterium]
MTVELIPLEGLPEFTPGDDLAAILAPHLRDLGVRHGDVVALTQKVLSKAEGRLASASDREAVVAAETVRVVARRGDLLIAETRHGLICANAGVDASNVQEGLLSLLPHDPDASATRLREVLTAELSVDVAVVITDTFGRPWREGVVNVAIGCAGLPALIDLRGLPDHHGRAMDTTVVALADEVAAASGLVMTKSARVPVAIVRGVDRAGAQSSAARDLVRAPAPI